MAQVSTSFQRLRKLRRRSLSGLLRGVLGGTPGVPRLKKLNRWLGDQSTRLAPTGTVQAFTANPANEQVTVTGHGFLTGSGPHEVVNVTGVLPAGLAEGTSYWLNVLTVNTFTLHLSYEDAVNGVRPVDITSAGTLVHNIVPRTAALALPEHLRQGVSPEELRDETDIDNLV